MFPDLMRDDVFRFETKRLWLRWPRAADAAAIADFAGDPDVARWTAQIPHPYPPQESERFILTARAENASGTALHLALTQKTAGRPVVGLISAHASASQSVEIGYVVAPAAAGKGLATEVVGAIVEAIFNLTPAMRIVATSRIDNIASRRVLEKSGFDHVDAGLEELPAPQMGALGLHPCDRFRIDRLTWQRRKAIRPMPPMAQQARAFAEAEAAEVFAMAAAAMPQY